MPCLRRGEQALLRAHPCCSPRLRLSLSMVTWAVLPASASQLELCCFPIPVLDLQWKHLQGAGLHPSFRPCFASPQGVFSLSPCFPHWYSYFFNP